VCGPRSGVAVGAVWWWQCGRVLLQAEAIETPRLVLTPLRLEDAEEMAGVLSDVRMYEFTGGEPPTLERLRARYELLAGGRSPDGSEAWLNWIVRTGSPPFAVGVVQATVRGDGTAGEVAWEIGVDHQGRGYASEAAAALVGWLAGAGIGAIEACIHPDHAASAAVAARAGLAPTDEFVDGERRWLLRPV
jgi:RimJ/RimL family protein N-acetyltransferase